MGLFGAVSVGVGAIVGGGILALAGVAFATTGPSAIVAFGLNGVIAVLTALSFAEMSAAFPQSGGTYTFAKKVLSVQAAFTVGWVVWFASIVAAVLYALGFAAFAVTIIGQVWQADFGEVPDWLASPWMLTALAIGATLLYTLNLTRQSSSGGQWVNVGKVAVFGVLIAGGLWVLVGQPDEAVNNKLTPFFPGGIGGLIQAMGYTFIALQGFDLIAAVAGEVRDPGRVIPRAMLISLGIALIIYLPLLFIIATVGMQPGQNILTESARQPATIIAVAAQNYLGRFGYWLVMVAAILSMLSALQANLFAASRVALAMARDRTLPRHMGQINPVSGTPIPAILATTLIIVAILLVIPDVAAAGAASSLIFLITFALAHGISILARRRGGERPGVFQVPWFPAVPLTGALACLGLAIFQGVIVPMAGIIAGVWLTIGGGLYLIFFARRAQVVDASAEALDPQLLKLRGRRPLVLAPIANPANAESMVFVADALAPPDIGRVMLLSVVQAPKQPTPTTAVPEQLVDTQAVLRQSLLAAFSVGLFPEALTTVARHPWQEISRVARLHACESLLLGLSDFTEDKTAAELEQLMNDVQSDVVVLRPPQSGWRISEANRILVPVGGHGGHDSLRARLLSSLWRASEREITFMQIVPASTSAQALKRIHQELLLFAQEEVPGTPNIEIILQSGPVAEEVAGLAQNYDLVVLGLPRLSHRRRVFGDVTLAIARDTACALIMISRH